MTEVLPGALRSPAIERRPFALEQAIVPLPAALLLASESPAAARPLGTVCLRDARRCSANEHRHGVLARANVRLLAVRALVTEWSVAVARASLRADVPRSLVSALPRAVR